MAAQHKRFPAGVVMVGLAAALSLGGCTAFENTTARTDDAIADFGARIGMPWGNQRPNAPPEPSVTVARLRDGAPPISSLAAEPGNVWPAEEAPRATLANPDAALRGIPEYRGPSGPGAAPYPSRDFSQEARPPRGRIGSSSPPPPPFEPARPAAVVPPPPPPINPAPPRTEGRVLTNPQGQPLVTTGGATTRSQTTLGPSGQPGVAQQSGGVTTLFGSDGTIRQVPTPR